MTIKNYGDRTGKVRKVNQRNTPDLVKLKAELEAGRQTSSKFYAHVCQTLAARSDG